jgi:hypothetical protein
MNKPKCIICDLDGTLADCSGRNPYDASRCDEIDLVNPAVNLILNLINDSNRDVLDVIDIILMSGRDSKFRLPTERWLSKHYIPYNALHMRKEGDRRKDSIIKRELYDEHIKDKYEVVFVLDDRDQVISLWRRDLGLHAFQVNYGDF